MKYRKGTPLGVWQEKKFGTCQKCNKEKDLTVEHIIPEHILLELGLTKEIYYDEENFAHYCHACNHFKSGRIDVSHPKTKGLLLKYINLL